MGDIETGSGGREVKLKMTENGVLRAVVFVYQQEHGGSGAVIAGGVLPPTPGGFLGGPVWDNNGSKMYTLAPRS